jgi:L-malate glycosyltransferase
MTDRPPLTVLHIFSGDLWAGAEVMIFHLLSQLKNDFGVNIIALSLNEGILTHKLRTIGIETCVVSESAYTFPGIYRRALQHIKSKHVDIIHSHRYKENLLALLLMKSLSTERLIATLHGLSETSARGRGRLQPTRLREKLNYFILNRYFADVVVVSGEMKTFLACNYFLSPAKLHVIHNGVVFPTDIGERTIRKDADKFRIGTVSRLVRVKDLELFLNVAKDLKPRMPNVEFSILGDGPLKEQLLRRAEELNLADIVTFLPACPDPFPYYRSLDAFLNTSLHEGIPLTILEAMACGLPVVAAQVGGIPEIISHGQDGLLVEGRRAEKFSRFCLDLVENQELRKRIGKNASMKVARCFSGFGMASHYLNLYNSDALR